MEKSDKPADAPAQGYQPEPDDSPRGMPKGGTGVSTEVERDPTAPYESTQAMALVPVQILRPTNFKEAQEMAAVMARTDMVPKDYRGKPANIIVAWQLGAELGLAPMQSLQNIANINGRPGVWGDAALALCKAHHSFQDVEEWVDGTGDKMVAYCLAQRKGKKDVKQSFSADDAKKAGLWGKNVHGSYPRRMLQMRARGFALRDQWPDVLKGIHTVEELQHLPPVETETEVITVDLGKEGTQSFREPKPEEQAAPSEASTEDPRTQEDKEVDEALELIGRADSRAKWKEVGGLIHDVQKNSQWSKDATDKVREALIQRGQQLPAPEKEPEWPKGQPPAPDKDSFGF